MTRPERPDQQATEAPRGRSGVAAETCLGDPVDLLVATTGCTENAAKTAVSICRGSARWNDR